MRERRKDFIQLPNVYKLVTPGSQFESWFTRGYYILGRQPKWLTNRTILDRVLFI